MRDYSVALLASSLPLLSTVGIAAPVRVTNPGFEAGVTGALPSGWHTGIAATDSASTSGYSVVLDGERPREGLASVRLESVAGNQSDFGTITSSIDATPYRGHRIRLTGAVRATPAEDGTVGLWLRVDRVDGQRGFFDNMGDRPITSADWSEYSIEGDVAADAKQLVFGLLLIGHGRAWLDDVRLDDIGPAQGSGIPVGWGSRPRSAPMTGDAPPKLLSRSGLVNLHAFARLYGLVRYFHPSDEGAATDWDRIAIAGVARVERAHGANELARSLRAIFGFVAPTVEIYNSKQLPRSVVVTRPAEAVDAVRWHHIGYGDDPAHIYKSERKTSARIRRDDIYIVALPGGVSARIPLVLWRNAKGATLPRASVAAIDTGKPAGFIPAGFDRTTRLAAVVSAWSMLGQFYPYFDRESRAGWNAALTPALRGAAADTDDLAFRDTLRRLISKLNDGHAGVPYYQPESGSLPLAWDWVEGQLVVTATGKDVHGVNRGDVVSAIDGVPSALAVARKVALESGSPQWTRLRALDDLRTGPIDHQAILKIGKRSVPLMYGKDAMVAEAKPEAIAELYPGLFYVDIDRVTQSGFDARVPDLAKANGVIFDLRGYPRMSPAFLQHLSGEPVKSGHFVSLAFDRPDRPGLPTSDGQWTLSPLAPRFTTNVAFIADATAISYSESILSVVAGNHLADIIGSPSAGANGNITFFNLPGGYQVSWTGMRVTNSDGSRHYLFGVRPTIPVKRTLSGIRAGRDELLERAIELEKARMTWRPSQGS